MMCNWKRALGVLIAVGAVIGGATPLQAGLITNSGLLPVPTSTVDFSQFNGSYTQGGAATQVGALVGENIIWSSTNNSFQGGAVIGDIGSLQYGLGNNGYWDGGRGGFVGLNAVGNPSFTMTFNFNSGPVGGVGGFVNYAADGFGDFIIEALGLGGVVLESHNITALAPISTPNGVNDGAFRGILRATNDIYGFRLSGAYDVLDDLQFGRFDTAVPVPSAVVLFGIGIVGLTGFRTLRRKNAVTVA